MAWYENPNLKGDGATVGLTIHSGSPLEGQHMQKNAMNHNTYIPNCFAGLWANKLAQPGPPFQFHNFHPAESLTNRWKILKFSDNRFRYDSQQKTSKLHHGFSHWLFGNISLRQICLPSWKDGCITSKLRFSASDMFGAIGDLTEVRGLVVSNHPIYNLQHDLVDHRSLNSSFCFGSQLIDKLWLVSWDCAGPPK